MSHYRIFSHSAISGKLVTVSGLRLLAILVEQFLFVISYGSTCFDMEF